jgi:hypothetical protein
LLLDLNAEVVGDGALLGFDVKDEAGTAHRFDNFKSDHGILGEDELVIYPIDYDAIMANEETMITWAEMEVELLGQRITEELIEELGGVLVTVQGLGEMRGRRRSWRWRRS